MNAACLANLVCLATAPHGTGPWWPFGAADLPMLLCLPVLLLFSAFFSGTETALFGLTAADRMSLRRTHHLAGRAADALLAGQRMLLITVLLGNTTINVLYFVTSAVLMMRSEAGPVGEVIMAGLFLFVIIIIGEIVPKMLASRMRLQFSVVAAPLMLTVHRVIGPFRALLAHVVIGPLSRLTAPHQPPGRLHDEELKALVELSHQQGEIDPDEQRMLADVLAMRRLRVRDVMTPRVRMAAIPHDASRSDVQRLVRESRLTKIPVYEGDFEHILGVLHVKRFLFDRQADSIVDPAVMTPPQFVPEVATLDQLLEFFRQTGSQSAIVVDEFGGTEGIVSVEDVVEELVGDIVAADEQGVEPPRLIGLGTWRISGDMSVHEWTEAFEIDLDQPKVSTVGGLITERLGRAPAVGDVIDVDGLHLEVEHADRGRVVSVLVTLRDEASDQPAGREEDR